MASAIQQILRQVAAARRSEEEWFVLPDEGDESVNYMDFKVEVEAPEVYAVDPARAAADKAASAARAAAEAAAAASAASAAAAGGDGAPPGDAAGATSSSATASAAGATGAAAEGAAAPRPLPYAGGTFRLRLTFPLDYPNSPPAVHFVTHIWHPQVELPSLKPCVDVLKNGWKPTKTLRDVLEVRARAHARIEACATSQAPPRKRMRGRCCALLPRSQAISERPSSPRLPERRCAALVRSLRPSPPLVDDAAPHLGAVDRLGRQCGGRKRDACEPRGL